MIAITITVLAMAAVYTTFIVQQRSFTTQDQVAETEVSSKIAFDMLVNDIRDAGFGYPSDENPVVNAVTEVVTSGDGGINSDTITLIGGFRQIATFQNFVPNTPNQIMINYTGGTEFDLINRRNLSIDGIFFAAIVPIAGCIIVNNTCSDAQPLILDRDILVDIPNGRPVYLVEDVTYAINAGNLERTGRVGMPTPTVTLANNIDDLQFAYGVDTDDDGLINAYTNDPLTDEVINIRASVLARTANEDQTLAPATKPYFATGIILENRTTADADRLRRRIWSMDTALRN
jgi:archaellin